MLRGKHTEGDQCYLLAERRQRSDECGIFGQAVPRPIGSFVRSDLAGMIGLILCAKTLRMLQIVGNGGMIEGYHQRVFVKFNIIPVSVALR